MPKDIDSKILDTVNYCDELKQTQIIHALKDVASKNTVIKHLKTMTAEKQIKRHKRGKYITYTLTNSDNETDLDKSLCNNLDAIKTIVEQTKTEMSNYYYDAKMYLNKYFEQETETMTNHIKNCISAESRMRKSELPYLHSRHNEIKSGLARLRKSNSHSDEDLKMLRDIIEAIMKELYDADDYVVQRYKDLDSTTDRRSRDAIKKTIKEKYEFGIKVNNDFEIIYDFVKFENVSLNDPIMDMHKKYIKKEPDIVNKIAELLYERDEHHGSVLWRIWGNLSAEAKKANEMEILCYNHMMRSRDASEIDRLRGEISGWRKIFDDTQMQLKKLEEWLVAKKPIYDVGESFLHNFPKFNLTQNEKYYIVIEKIRTNADIKAICRKYKITCQMLSYWETQFLEAGRIALR